jgi:hypothetical protein
MITELTAGRLRPERAAIARMFVTERQWEAIDVCLQLHGGAGYMNEYETARLSMVAVDNSAPTSRTLRGSRATRTVRDVHGRCATWCRKVRVVHGRCAASTRGATPGCSGSSPGESEVMRHIVGRSMRLDR